MGLLVSLTSVSDMTSISGDEETIMKMHGKHKIFLQNEHVLQTAFTKLEF